MFLAKATVWSKRSYEKEFNGVVRGIFSVALMEALANAPARENRVTGKAVKEYIDQNIKRIAGNQAIEEPTINGRKYDEIIFCQRPAAAPHRAPRKFTLTVKADGAADGAEVTLFDGNLVLAETKPVINRTAVFQVTPGMYKVALPGTDRKSLLEIVLEDIDHRQRQANRDNRQGRGRRRKYYRRSANNQDLCTADQ